MTYTDDTAIVALKNGHEKAFTWVYDTYSCRLRIYAEKLIECAETAADIVHDLFMKLWENRKKTEIASLKTYLYGSVKNACLKHIEHIKVRQKYHDSFLDENSEACNSNNPESILIREETENIIERVIAALPQQCRRVFVLWWKEGFSYEEIAKKTGISVDVIKTQIYRAKTKLREIIGSNQKK